MTIKVLSYQDALKEAEAIGKKKQILLGNGFSIACHPSFKYGTLFEQAKKTGLQPHIEELLIRYGNHFEEVLKYLDEGAFLAKHYGLTKPRKAKRDMEKDYDALKRILVRTISDNHPDYPSKISDNKFGSCLSFLRTFDAVYTVNYDLLLYWSALHINSDNGQEFPFADGFGREGDSNDPNCSFSYSSMENKPYLFFLHGALHLYAKDGHVWKRVWNTTGIPLITQVREAYDKKEYPLVVAEGQSPDKMRKIESSSYLSQAYRKFKNIQGHLFIYGHSLGDQDDHIMDAIIHAEKLRLNHLWIGLYGDQDTAYNKTIIQKAIALQLRRDQVIPKGMRKKEEGALGIHFFSSESAAIWGKS